MHTLALTADPTAADWMTAWGTLLTALLAIVSVGVTIYLAHQDRERSKMQLATERTEAEAKLQAERAQHQEDLERADRQLAEERERTARELLRQHHLQVLADVTEQYARFGAYSDQAQSEASRRLQVLLRMLPDGAATLLKHQFHIEQSPMDSRALGAIGQAHGDSIPATPDAAWVFEELAANAVTLAVDTPTCGRQQ